MPKEVTITLHSIAEDGLPAWHDYVGLICRGGIVSAYLRNGGWEIDGEIIPTHGICDSALNKITLISAAEATHYVVFPPELFDHDKCTQEAARRHEREQAWRAAREKKPKRKAA